jgi:acetylornithine aminotransferase/acetylornithine/N-succinyldiaminopimelate aminotransferase
LARLLAEGILINRTHDAVLRFLPPYIIGKKHVDEVVRRLDLALKETPTANPKGHRVTPRKTTEEGATQ